MHSNPARRANSLVALKRGTPSTREHNYERRHRRLGDMNMTPALVLAGVVISMVVPLACFYALGHKGRGLRRLHIKITLFPPSLDLDIEQRSD